MSDPRLSRRGLLAGGAATAAGALAGCAPGQAVPPVGPQAAAAARGRNQMLLVATHSTPPCQSSSTTELGIHHLSRLSACTL